MLQLDVSVYSPSDSEHWYKYLTFQPDLPSEEYAFPLMEQQLILVRPEYDDHKHGWRAGRQVSLPSERALLKTFDEIMNLGPFDNEAQDKEWWEQLPLVPAVTSVLLRNRPVDDGSRRRWHCYFRASPSCGSSTMSPGENGRMLSRSSRIDSSKSFSS